jgi:hypothetical protein
MTYHAMVTMKRNEIGGACGTYGKRRGAYKVLVENPEEKNHMEYLVIDGRIMLQ